MGLGSHLEPRDTIRWIDRTPNYSVSELEKYEDVPPQVQKQSAHDRNNKNNSLANTRNITWKDIETAQIRILEEGFRVRYNKGSNFIKNYAGYVKRLRKEDKPNECIRHVAMMLFPNEESYKERMARYRKWYAKKKNLLKSVENLYTLYYELSKEYRNGIEEDFSRNRSDPQMKGTLTQSCLFEGSVTQNKDVT